MEKVFLMLSQVFASCMITDNLFGYEIPLLQGHNASSSRVRTAEDWVCWMRQDVFHGGLGPEVWSQRKMFDEYGHTRSCWREHALQSLKNALIKAWDEVSLTDGLLWFIIINFSSLSAPSSGSINMLRRHHACFQLHVYMIINILPTILYTCTITTNNRSTTFSLLFLLPMALNHHTNGHY